MAPTTLLSHLVTDEHCVSLDLFNDARNDRPANSSRSDSGCRNVGVNSSNAALNNGVSSSPRSSNATPVGLSLILDAESCLDRLYGGFYSDWASGGQWNRLLAYLNNLARACEANHLNLTIALRGGLEKEHAEELFKSNKEFKDRLNRVMTHLQNRGTPPPKVWWLPPTCLREVISISVQFFGIKVFCTSDDFYKDVMSFARAHKVDGILTDNLNFLAMNPPRLFSARDFKLTYRGSLETREYRLSSMMSALGLTVDRMPLLTSLLGTHIVSLTSLKEFHQELVAKNDSNYREDLEHRVVMEVVDFVSKFPDPTNLDAIGHVVFRNSSTGLEDNIERLKASVAYYQQASTINQPQPASGALKTVLEVIPHKMDASERKSHNPSLQSNCSRDSSADREKVIQKSEDDTECVPNGLNGLSSDNEVKECLPIKMVVVPSYAILQLASERHSRGLMAPIILQVLTRREVRLPCYLENVLITDATSIIELYRPIRQAVYAVLHNLNKHLYDARRSAEQNGLTVRGDDITISVIEHHLDLLGSPVATEVKVTPLAWPVPSVESLWLGVKPENKQRRMKAFLSCMGIGQGHLLLNPTYVPEHFLLISSVLRYLLKSDPPLISLAELDAVLAMATSSVLFDVQTMQDMQLPLIAPRGAHLASLLMAGLQHAMMVNDACGAPVPSHLTCPWLFFDGKLLQYKLLKASSMHQTPLIDLCDGQLSQVLTVECLRQAILSGLDDKFSLTVHTLPFVTSHGRLFASPAAFIRPSPSSGRGKGLLGPYMPAAHVVDPRGGKLQVAGHVVATWGPSTAARGNNSQRTSSSNFVTNHQPTEKRVHNNGTTEVKPQTHLRSSLRSGKSRHDNKKSVTNGLSHSDSADALNLAKPDIEQANLYVLPDNLSDQVSETTFADDVSKITISDELVEATASSADCSANSSADSGIHGIVSDIHSP